eukprot:TRINITY_DN10695_c0_g1_i1.p1 TRINITY_DN10695_c0_g1~~TRINITY_DN10695_c0_g1_i1.p1  ORF type:complete len:816 (-),score=171.50 TRINITY_DN10695_c0_g1_i1:134-2581(-)
MSGEGCVDDGGSQMKRKSQDPLSFYRSSSDEEDPDPNEEASSKRFKGSSVEEPGTYSSAAQRMMSRMGHKEGKGLGKLGQGRVEPVSLSTQKGRRGLGLVVASLDSADIVFEEEREHVVLQEPQDWIPRSNYVLPKPQPQEWILEGPRKESVENETEFVDPLILKGVLKAKNIFDSLQLDEVRKARSRSNPFETISKAIFLNRAAVKMANMDAIFDFMFTSPKTMEGEDMVKRNELLYFADVCAGPGGFSEYVLWRKQWRAKGFGFTLKGNNDFRTDDFIQGPPECFEKHYGMDDDGDVFKEGNIVEFTNFVMDSTEGRGVHFMMADGGFGVEGKENIQEILSKQLYLCQFLVAMSIVRVGGHFVCKLFDLFTPFSVNLVYLMYKSFEAVAIHKPNTSRPANSERYIICKWKKEDTGPVTDYLMNINRLLNEKGFSLDGTTRSPTDVNEIVPRDILFHETDFIEYMQKSNNLLGDWQIVALTKIAAFAKDRNRMDTRQGQIRDESLRLWNVPDHVRKNPPPANPKFAVPEVICEAVLTQKPGCLATPSDLDTNIKSIHDWKCMFVGDAIHRTFFYGQGRYNVFYLSSRDRWQKVEPEVLKIDLPRGSLIYGEITKEIRGVQKSQKRVNAFHIMDAIFLGSEDLRHRSFLERTEAIKLFVKSISKKTIQSHTIIRSKSIFSLENLPQELESLSLKVVKGCGPIPRITLSVLQNGADPFYISQGILLFREVSKSYIIARSKSCANRKYWFNIYNKSSSYDCPPDGMANFEDSFCPRLFWNFSSGANIVVPCEGGNQAKDEANLVHSSTFTQFITSRS